MGESRLISLPILSIEFDLTMSISFENHYKKINGGKIQKKVF